MVEYVGGGIYRKVEHVGGDICRGGIRRGAVCRRWNVSWWNMSRWNVSLVECST